LNCANVGNEIWLLFGVSSLGVVLCCFAAGSLQKWLREHRAVFGWMSAVPDVVFRDSGVWAIRAFGIIPALMWIVAAIGVYCYLHGPG